MGYLPQLQMPEYSRQTTTEFGGLNHNLRISDAEFFDMENMSSDLFPIVTPRKLRTRVRQFAHANGLYAHNDLCWVDGRDVFYAGQRVGRVTDSKKQIIGMGSYILIWPDKVGYNTETGELFELEHSVETSGDVSVTLCQIDGNAYDNVYVSETAPENPQNGDLWMDTGKTPHVLRVYSSTQSMWQGIATTYIKLQYTGIGAGFEVDDAVDVSGFNDEMIDGTHIITACGNDYIVYTGIIDENILLRTPASIKRSVPDMDYLCESENRIWGCSSEAHEIYACALGNPKVWYRYAGISTDSFAMTVGSQGDFTGCIAFAGSVLFFKADVIHKLYGNRPSNYQLSNINCRGCAPGSEKSLIVNNESLYYLSTHDVLVMYQTSLPSAVSANLGSGLRYKNASAGSVNGKYYVSMQDESGKYWMYVYDEYRNLWHKEDSVKATYFATLEDTLYFIDDNTNVMYSIGTANAKYGDSRMTQESPISWMIETGDIGITTPDAKYVTKIQIRLEIDEQSLVCIDVRHDFDTDWNEALRINPGRKRTYTVPLIPQRCDTMRIRIRGTGRGRIFSVSKMLEAGGEY